MASRGSATPSPQLMDRPAQSSSSLSQQSQLGPNYSSPASSTGPATPSLAIQLDQSPSASALAALSDFSQDSVQKIAQFLQKYGLKVLLQRTWSYSTASAVLIGH